MKSRKLTLQGKIKEALETKMRLNVTKVKRSKHGFLVTIPDGGTVIKSKKVALQFLLAVARCHPVSIFTIKAVKHKTK